MLLCGLSIGSFVNSGCGIGIFLGYFIALFIAMSVSSYFYRLLTRACAHARTHQKTNTAQRSRARLDGIVNRVVCLLMPVKLELRHKNAQPCEPISCYDSIQEWNVNEQTFVHNNNTPKSVIAKTFSNALNCMYCTVQNRVHMISFRWLENVILVTYKGTQSDLELR